MCRDLSSSYTRCAFWQVRSSLRLGNNVALYATVTHKRVNLFRSLLFGLLVELYIAVCNCNCSCSCRMCFRTSLRRHAAAVSSSSSSSSSSRVREIDIVESQFSQRIQQPRKFPLWIQFPYAVLLRILRRCRRVSGRRDLVYPSR